MTKNNITVGVDVGGTNTVIGFVDDDGNYLAGTTIPTFAEENANKFIVRLAEQIKLMSMQNGIQVNGIGVAAPSANYFLGTIESPSNLKWGSVNFVELMKEHFDIPVAITNDANAAALGELAFGSAQGMKNFIVITLGTGLGSGIVVDGKMLYGEHGLAGELGHMVVKPNGRECSCGKAGCLETYVSAGGLKRTVFDLLGHSRAKSKLRDYSFNNLTAKQISEMAMENDPIALNAFYKTGEILGQAFVNIVLCYNPEAIILFGGLVDSGDLLLQPAKNFYEKGILDIYKNKVKILKSGLQSGKAAVLGASTLISNKLDEYNFKLS